MRTRTVVVGVVGMLIVGGAVAGKDDDSGGATDDRDYAAFDVCTRFVADHLRSPGTAEFRNYFEDDGEVVVTNVGGVYTVRSSVDSENGFGALLRSGFTCTVRPSGDRWRLESLTFDE